MSLINAILEQLLNGLRTGSIYALIALGYTMVYGIAKMINFAHGDIIMVGAYTLYVCVSLLHLHPILAVIITILVCALLGVVIEKIAYKPLRQAPPLAVLITAIGVSYLLQNLALHRHYPALFPLYPALYWYYRGHLEQSAPDRY